VITTEGNTNIYLQDMCTDYIPTTRRFPAVYRVQAWVIRPDYVSWQAVANLISRPSVTVTQ